MLRWRWIIILLIGWGAFNAWSHRPKHVPPSVVVSVEPQQRTLSRPVEFVKRGYTIEGLASFDIEARVLATESYRFDRESELAPIDLALGWGPMSDSAVLKDISISQGHRYYHWRVAEFPIPEHDIVTHSADMHMIPANSAVEKRLHAVRPGEIVSISGYLVEARAGDGWRWRSSLTRADTGAGACELVWVEQIAVC
jgi:hypothetical protein